MKNSSCIHCSTVIICKIIVILYKTIKTIKTKIEVQTGVMKICWGIIQQRFEHNSYIIFFYGTVKLYFNLVK